MCLWWCTAGETDVGTEGVYVCMGICACVCVCVLCLKEGGKEKIIEG